MLLMGNHPEAVSAKSRLTRDAWHALRAHAGTLRTQPKANKHSKEGS
ncbi:hypothetical protein EDD95_4650 [Streptomyces sp. CEV 2-1]|nr:hypothetical protein EDD95_4650 [Streptomyces sp. CEV 2-1]